MAIPATITYFVTYEQLRVVLHDNYIAKTGELVQPIWIPLLSGAIARIWAVTIVNPLELIRTKMQSKKLSYNGILFDLLLLVRKKTLVYSPPFISCLSEVRSACRSLMESRGISGFWLGWSPTILRDVPFSGKHQHLTSTLI